MKNVMYCGLVAAVLAGSVASGAQDGKTSKMDGMKSEQSYTGCIERSQDGAFTLAHATASDAVKKQPMAKDSMANGSVAKDPMEKGSMMKDAMAPALGLSSTSVDLAKHVGHKVTVRGVNGDTMSGMATLTVKSIKMVASSCS
jgi:hypothetical protein